jgi:hypothetical protein
MTPVEAKPKAGKDEASLLVHDTTQPLRSMVVFEGEAKHGRHVFFSAFQYEKVEGMLIARRSGAKPRWSGSLRVPLLGGQPFLLTGGDFQAQLIKGSILD